MLTAASLAKRCFPGAVRVVLDDRLAASPLLPWPSMGLTFGQALSRAAGRRRLLSGHRDHSRERDGTAIVFGDANAPDTALRVTFDGWIAATGPAEMVARLPERSNCVLSGILASSLAVSEIFMSCMGVSVAATRRRITHSLWRPGADVLDPEARGVSIEFLPRALWVLGLGHLGNAYLWAIAALQHPDPGEVEVVLNDFDRVEPENVETGLLFTNVARGQFKTRVCSAWLEKRGFRTRIVERRFDEHFRCQADEPRLALCGFDNNAARRHLKAAEFDRVLESGLGGKADNFDTLAVHTFPQFRRVEELWRDASPEEIAADHEHRMRAAQQSAAYQPVAKVPAAFERRCIPPDGVVRRLRMPNMRPPHALSAGRLTALGATRGFHHGLLCRYRARRVRQIHAGRKVHRRAVRRNRGGEFRACRSDSTFSSGTRVQRRQVADGHTGPYTGRVGTDVCRQ